MVREDSENGALFKVPKTLLVPKERDGSLLVSFEPDWLCSAFSELTIRNPKTEEKFIFSLKGRSLEPLSENHIPLECKIGEEKIQILELKSFGVIDSKKSGPKLYKVEYDMKGVSGPSEVLLNPIKSTSFRIKISPKIGGIFGGKITFTDEQGQYFWYSMELMSHGERNSKEYSVTSVIR